MHAPKVRQPPATVVPLDRTAVFEVLSDPNTYPRWLVGAREIRDVEPEWPALGSRFFHRVGLAGPLTVADSTKVVDVDPPRRLSLEVRVRPFGRGRATFRLYETVSDDHPGLACTRIELTEEPLGILRLARFALDPVVDARNRRSLTHLHDFLVEEVGSPAKPPG
jgi:uncharacterized protein YndB with AHSA1/START domain